MISRWVWGLRFLSFRRNGSEGGRFLVWMSWIALLGVALGVMSLGVVLSVINGFEGEIARVVTDVNGHALLYTRGEPLEHPEAWVRELLPPSSVLAQEVEAWSPAFVLEGMVASVKGVGAFGALLQGVDFKTFFQVTRLEKALQEGAFPSFESPGVVLGKELARKLQVGVGDSVRVLLPLSQLPLWELKVTGVASLGLYDYDSQWVWLPLGALQAFLGQPGRVTHLHFRLHEGRAAEGFAQALSEKIQHPLRVKDWSQLNHNLFYAIQLEKAVIAVLLVLILVVATFNIASMLLILTQEKAQAVSVLRVLGFETRQVWGLFAGLGFGVATAGILCGGLGMALVLGVLQKTQWIPLAASVYSISFLPVQVRPIEMVWVSVGTLGLAFLASCYPAFEMARKAPLEGLDRQAG